MARILLILLEKIFTCAHPHSENLTEAMHNYRYYYYKYYVVPSRSIKMAYRTIPD